MIFRSAICDVPYGVVLWAAMMALVSSGASAQSDGEGPLSAEKIHCAGNGRFRVVVEVAPVKLGKRETDELPADLKIDLSALLKQAGIRQRANMASLQVIQFNGNTGEPVRYDNYGPRAWAV